MSHAAVPPHVGVLPAAGAAGGGGSACLSSGAACSRGHKGRLAGRQGCAHTGRSGEGGGGGGGVQNGGHGTGIERAWNEGMEWAGVGRSEEQTVSVCAGFLCATQWEWGPVAVLRD